MCASSVVAFAPSVALGSRPRRSYVQSRFAPPRFTVCRVSSSRSPPSSQTSQHRIKLNVVASAANVPDGEPSISTHVGSVADSASRAEPPSMDGGSGGKGGRDLRPFLAGGFVAFVSVLVVGGWITGGLSGDTFVMLAEWFQALGPSAIFVYSALYFALELLAVPATPLTLGCGYLFGVGPGTAAVSVASTAAAAVSFLIARYGLREWTSKLVDKYPKFRAIDRAVGREGFKFVFLLRLSPLLPFALSNYLYGLSAVKFQPYVLASWAGMLPGTIAYVSAGAAFGALTDISVHRGSINPFLIGLGLVATIGAVTAIGKVASSAISETVELEDGI